MIKRNREWQIVSHIFRSHWSPGCAQQRKAKRNNLEGGRWDFAPVSFRVMMFEIFLLYSVGSSRSLSLRFTVTLVSTQTTLHEKNEWIHVRSTTSSFTAREKSLYQKWLLFTFSASLAIKPVKPIFFFSMDVNRIKIISKNDSSLR